MHAERERPNNIRQHYIENHLTPCEHKVTYTLPYVDIQRIVVFLANYAEEYAILLPGRMPGYKRNDMQLLLYRTTKKVSTINGMSVVGEISSKYSSL